MIKMLNRKNREKFPAKRRQKEESDESKNKYIDMRKMRKMTFILPKEAVAGVS